MCRQKKIEGVGELHRALWQHLEFVFWSLVEYAVLSIEAPDKRFLFMGSTETRSFQSLSGIFHLAGKEYWLKYPLSI